MKKIIILFILSISLFGCSNSKDKTIYNIKLDVNPSMWDYEIDGDGAVEINDRYEENNCSKEACNGYQNFTIKGLSKGNVQITFIKEEDMYGEQEKIIYNLNIDKDLTIKLISKEKKID